MSHFYPEIHTAKIQELLKRLPKEIVIEHVLFTAEFAVTSEPVSFAKRRTLSYKPIREGQAWGETWDCGWFHLKGKVPKSWAGAYVTARLDFGGELLVFDGKGEPIVGLTNGSVFDATYNKDTMHLFPKCKGGEAVDLWVDAGANSLFGMIRCGDPAWLDDKSKIHGTYTGQIIAMRLCRFDYDKWQLWLDLQILESLLKALPEKSARRMQILRVASKALDIHATRGARASRAALNPIFVVRSDPATVDVTGVGHAHIDTAWLWPLRETIRKCGRTFASQLGLIKRYPGYVFGASQAQLYAFTKQHYPTLYAKIKRAVTEGKWEVQGGMWVEADCNLISGESMVRQFVHGKNFFRDEFGIEVKNLWLPDVFGYSGNLPQILQKAGMPYFLTQKLSWNRYNKFPHNTFIWRGIDGSEVLAHFPSEDDYNSAVMPEALCKNETNNQERGLVQEALCLFGIGNGGGGPKEEHIERALRLRDLNGAPRLHFGHAQPILEKLATYRPDLATWSGELYFETHRGTLTTQAGVKRWNRRAEEALRAAEMICASADLDSYPIAAFDRLWKTTLLNQFHDIIPGSSIHRVYEETIPMLQNVVAQARELEHKAARRMLTKAKQALTVFNPSTEGFAKAIKLPSGWQQATTLEGVSVPVQHEADGVVAWVQATGQQFITLTRGTGRARRAVCAPASGHAALVLENEQVRYEFDTNLRLVRAFDKEAAMEVIPSNEPGNCLSLYDDHPTNCDAWDIEEYYGNQRLSPPRVENIERVAGEVRTGLQATLQVGEASTIRQQIWLGREGKRLDFVTEVAWNENHKLLRVAFPTTIQTDKASSEIQYGFVQRNTADNTKWDYAQFECVAHRYADLSNHDYGVALLNDSKYGYRIKGHTVELSLLRAPTEPDPAADISAHQFTYSFLPHKGDLITSDVRANAAAINQGLKIFDGFAATDAALPVTISGDGLELAVLKRAEKEKCLIIRVIETRGLLAQGELLCAKANAKITPTDLMEWHDEPRKKATGHMALTLKPFEIQTFKIT